MANAAARVARLLAEAATAIAGVVAAAVGRALAAVAGNMAELAALSGCGQQQSPGLEALEGSPCSTQHRPGRRLRRRSWGSPVRCGPAGRSGSTSWCPWGPRGNHGLRKCQETIAASNERECTHSCDPRLGRKSSPLLVQLIRASLGARPPSAKKLTTAVVAVPFKSSAIAFHNGEAFGNMSGYLPLGRTLVGAIASLKTRRQ